MAVGHQQQQHQNQNQQQAANKRQQDTGKILAANANNNRNNKLLQNSAIQNKLETDARDHELDLDQQHHLLLNNNNNDSLEQLKNNSNTLDSEKVSSENDKSLASSSSISCDSPLNSIESHDDATAASHRIPLMKNSKKTGSAFEATNNKMLANNRQTMSPATDSSSRNGGSLSSQTRLLRKLPSTNELTTKQQAPQRQQPVESLLDSEPEVENVSHDLKQQQKTTNKKQLNNKSYRGNNNNHDTLLNHQDIHHVEDSNEDSNGEHLEDEDEDIDRVSSTSNEIIMMDDDDDIENSYSRAQQPHNSNYHSNLASNSIVAGGPGKVTRLHSYPSSSDQAVHHPPPSSTRLIRPTAPAGAPINKHYIQSQQVIKHQQQLKSAKSHNQLQSKSNNNQRISTSQQQLVAKQQHSGGHASIKKQQSNERHHSSPSGGGDQHWQQFDAYNQRSASSIKKSESKLAMIEGPYRYPADMVPAGHPAHFAPLYHAKHAKTRTCILILKFFVLLLLTFLLLLLLTGMIMAGKYLPKAFEEALLAPKNFNVTISG